MAFRIQNVFFSRFSLVIYKMSMGTTKPTKCPVCPAWHPPSLISLRCAALVSVDLTILSSQGPLDLRILLMRKIKLLIEKQACCPPMLSRYASGPLLTGWVPFLIWVFVERTSKFVPRPGYHFKRERVTGTMPSTLKKKKKKKRPKLINF